MPRLRDRGAHRRLARLRDECFVSRRPWSGIASQQLEPRADTPAELREEPGGGLLAVLSRRAQRRDEQRHPLGDRPGARIATPVCRLDRALEMPRDRLAEGIELRA